MKKIKSCPHCGSTYGFYRKCNIKGTTEIHHNFPGTKIISKAIVGCSGPPDTNEMDNGEMYDCLEYKENKTAFCIECRKPIRELKQ
ncbi:MAG: hypothetical protein GY941_23465 [Planctomycetes bacterium]|nr:hypothetical protein [Planctomycetota bacterium]